MQNNSKIRAAAVYCGSAGAESEPYNSAAAAFGGFLAARGVRLVYGGSAVGTMKTLADAVLAAGGEVTGVFPPNLSGKLLHPHLTETVLVRSMAERKQTMIDRADVLIALPGGIGTLDEFFDALALRKLETHRKPCGLLNVNHYYDRLLDFLNHTATTGFIDSTGPGLFDVSASPEELFEKFAIRLQK